MSRYVKTCQVKHISVFLGCYFNKEPRSFHKTVAITAGLSDYHEMIITTIRSSLTRKTTAKYHLQELQKF